ncbi:tyrosine-type recombinase/integrase [Paraburkholderia hayleyella]|uniref:tyrosine-type recombinase/integrase n=1 Tax=Paraburkholderia hayleyella TaxID=2152889 RepID=UPI001FE74D81|nr:tyrosine-type recombinase/integrase [Paraburkholderia hayleyella]
MPHRYLDKGILPHIGGKRVCELLTEDVWSVIWRKKEPGLDAAAGQVCGLLKCMLDSAMTCGLLSANPITALPMRHVYKAVSRERALLTEEIKQFLQAAQQSNIRRQFKIILLTLVRKSELLLARRKDRHLEEAEWHIPEENSKTGKPHIVYLSSQAMMPFKELLVLAGNSE